MKPSITTEHTWLILPRKLLNYRTPLDVFLEEVNKIVDLATVQFHIAI